MSDPLKEKIDAIVARYKPEIDRLTAEGQEMEDGFEEPSKGGAMIGVDFEAEWADTKVIFDVPSITMRDRDVSFDLPSVTMRTRKIIFDTPSVRMRRVKTGEYPEVHGWTIKWKPIYIDVPEPFMERQEISFDIPEVTMERVNLRLAIPEFRMKRVEWVLRLPQITVVNVRAETDALKAKGEDLSRRAAELAARMKAEIETAIGGFSASSSEQITRESQNVRGKFDTAIRQVSGAIDQLVARNVDPIKVPAGTGDINLRKTLTELMAERDRVSAQFEEVNAPVTAEPPKSRA
jgi:hypothetical protein